MSVSSEPQNARLLCRLEDGTMLRASELRAAGINPQTISRAVEAGEIERIGRGIYQKLGAEVEEGQILAEAALRASKGIVALVSDLALHHLTDQMPRRVLMAIRASDWAWLRIVGKMRNLRDGLGAPFQANTRARTIPLKESLNFRIWLPQPFGSTQ